MTATVTNDMNADGVTWAVTGGGTLSNTTASSATYTAPAATSSTLTVTVTATSVANTNQTGTLTLTVPAKLAISTTSTQLTGAVGAVYSVQLTTSGGISPYKWTVDASTPLPTNWSLSSTGLLTGPAPTNGQTGGTYTFDVSDSGTPTPLTTSQQLTVTITQAPAITITGVMPTTGTYGTPYVGSAAATGGAGALNYSYTGSLPSGLLWNTGTGALTGTPTAAGKFPFTVQAADNFGDTPATQGYTITIGTASQTITFANPGAQSVATPLTLSATASSGLAVSFASTTPSVCTVSGTAATMVAIGTCTIQATQPGNANYTAATLVSQTFTVNGEAQTITFNTIPTQNVGTPLALSATATSNLAVSFTSTTTSICTVSGTAATMVAIGTCTIQATQPGNSTYAAATLVSQTFTVNGEAQTVTFANPGTQTVGTPLALSATASSGLGVTFASGSSSVCTVSGTAATMLISGTCIIDANQAGNTTYAAAPQVSQSFSVNGEAQTIAFANPGTQTVGTPLTLSATASSSLGVTFASTTSSVCTVSGTAATMLTSGTCTVQATQPGNASYAAATAVSQSFSVNAESQTITFANPGTQNVGTPLTLSATASSNLAVSYTSTTTSVCTVSGTTATMLIAGTCAIQATQPGNASYAAATAVSQSFTVNLESQTITFSSPGAQTVGTPLALSATASSSLAVSFDSTTPTVCTVSGAAATMLIAGTCTIEATQAGNASYAAAPTVAQTFTVNGEAQTITFGPIAGQAVGTPLTLSATASSGLGVTFASLTSSVCSVSGTTTTFSTTGTCTIQATQTGNASYAAATSVSQSFTVSAESQTITFGTIVTQTVGTPLTLSATASSSLGVTFASTTTSVCSVTGTTATMLTSGTCTIQATQAGNSSYAAAPPVSQSFTVNAATQTITFTNPGAQTVGTPLTLSATASSNLAVSYSSLTTPVCTVSGSTATMLIAGTCTIQASQAGNSSYLPATSSSQTFTVNLESQSITFNTIPTQTVGTPLTLTAAASSGLAVTYTSTTLSICTVSGTAATMVTSGTCTIQATQPGNASYAAATMVPQSFTVNGEAQTINFANPGAQNVGTPLTLSATASSNLAVTFTSTTPSVCTVSGTSATMVATGTCTIQVTQAGNTTYAAATMVSQSFTVNGEAQTIAFTNPGAQTVGTPLTLSATASSGLAVTFASTTSSVCTVSGTSATMLTSGTCTIQVTQAGNSTYAAATMVSQSFTVNGEAQSITFNTIPTQTVGTPLTLSATASSGLAVIYTSTTLSICTVSGTAATMVTSGTCTIQATQPGNASYAAATMVPQSFTVNGEVQTITFNTIPAQNVGTPLTLSATASSGLAVTYSSLTTSICTVSGTTVSMLSTGTCTIQATQTGNYTYAAATSVSQNFTVNAATQTITFANPGPQNIGTPLTLSATASSGLPVSYNSQTTAVCTVSGTTATMVNTGTCTIQATQIGDGVNYVAATPVSQSFTVYGPTQTITFANPGPQDVGTQLALSATASSGLTVSFASTTSSVCSVSGTTATMLTAGTCTIQASQPGDSNYAAASQVSQSFTVYSAMAFTLNPSSLPSGTVGQNYNETITVSGGSGSGYAFSVMVGGTLTPVPAYQQGQLPVANGIVVSMQGTNELIISGTPATATSVALDVTVTDSTNGSLTQNYTINITNSNTGYSVSGTVTYTGPKTGWVYLELIPNNGCSNCNQNLGTAINAFNAGSLASGMAYTIHGVPAGTYTLKAYMDGIGFGLENASDPTGSLSNLNVTSAGLSNQNFTLQDPSAVSLGTLTPTWDPSNGSGVFSGGAAVSFDPICNGSGCNNGGVEMPTSYYLLYSTDSTFNSGVTRKCFLAQGGNSPWIVSGLTNGLTYYFRAAGYVGAAGTCTNSPGALTYSAAAPSGGLVINAPSAGSLLSGTVAFTLPTGVSASGKTLYVGCYASGTIYAAPIASPVSPQAYSVDVPNGTSCQVFGFLDLNNSPTGLIGGAGELSNTSNGVGMIGVTVNGATPNQNITLPSGNSAVEVKTQTYYGGSGSGIGYNVGFQVSGEYKLPVAVELLSETPNVNGTIVDVVLPADIATDAFNNYNNEFDYWPQVTGIPVVGDTYTFKVTYFDGTSETLTASVSGVLSAFATNLSPTGTDVSLTPNFSWNYPSSSASSYTYQFELDDNNGNTIWEIPSKHSNSKGFASTMTPSITWGVDPTNSGNLPSSSYLTNGGLSASTTYNWSISAYDSNMNEAKVAVNFITGTASLSLPAGNTGYALINTLYEQSLNASGGLGTFTFTVNGTPITGSSAGTAQLITSGGDGLSAFSNGSQLTVFGTPTTGPITLIVSVTDGTNAVQQTYTINVATLPTPGASNANNAKLNGTYVCKSSGYDDASGARWATLSTVIADGNGNFTTGGTYDTNTRDLSAAISGGYTGTYNIGADNNGIANMTATVPGFPNATSAWAIALTGSGSVAQEFRKVRIDDVGATPSGIHGGGVCYLATTSAFNYSTISGKSFAFGMQGEDASGSPLGNVGRFTAGTESATGGTGGAAGGPITNGYLDIFISGGSSEYAESYTGTYTVPNATTGRFTMSTTSPVNLALYIIDANRSFAIETDPVTNAGNPVFMQAGDGRLQQQSANTAAVLLNGSSVLYSQGFEYSSGSVSGYNSSVYQINGASSSTYAGSLTVNASYDDEQSTYKVGNENGQSPAVTFDSSHLGRATFSPGSDSAIFYFFGPGSAFYLDLNGTNHYLATGWLESQSGTFTDTGIAGTYLLGKLPPIVWNSNDAMGELDLLSSGNITGSATTAGVGDFTWDEPITVETYSWASTTYGTFTTGTGNKDWSCAVISATMDICITNGSGSAEMMILQQ
jgi:hypothetical protein